MKSSFQKILGSLVLALVIAGTMGYTLIEGWSIFDALYMTIITISTVGYGETHDLSPNGRIFTSILIPISVTLMACWTAEITSILVSGQISGKFKTQRERRMISAMNQHTIVCGGGVTALTVIRRLARAGTEVVAVTECPEEVTAIRRHAPNVPVVECDPKEEMALIDANLFQAKYLVAAVEADLDNLLITITGKGVGTDVQVISFAQSSELASRMTKVGADEVICPLVIGGEHVAALIESEKTPKSLEASLGN